MHHKIPLTRPSLGSAELDSIRKVLNSGILTEGSACSRFEQQFARYVGCKYSIATSSCTSALHLVLLSAGIGQGDEVIVPDFTFPATANVVKLVGATPVLVDIDPSSFNIDPQIIPRAITEKTKAIIAVHLFGLAADMNPILESAEKHDLYVFEDAACGVGTTYNGTRVGKFGDAACFSFHPRKILTTGEGGMVTTDNHEIEASISLLKNHGEINANGRVSFTVPGYNYRLSDVLAAIGVVQLKRVSRLIKSRVRIARTYDELLSKVDGITPPSRGKDLHTYQSYVVRVEDEFGLSRDRVLSGLRQLGIEAQIGTYALHLEPAFEDSPRVDNLRNSKDAFEKSLSLPISSIMKTAQAENVVKAIRSIQSK